MGVAALALAGSAFAAKFGGYLNPGAAQHQILNLTAGDRQEIRVEGMANKAEFRLRVYQKVGAGWALVKEKDGDENELRMTFPPAVSTQYAVQVRNIGPVPTAYTLWVKDAD